MTGIVDVYQKAELAANKPTQETYKDLNSSVIDNFFKPRMEYHRSIGHVEALLQGKEQEREALECYLRTQPRLGKRKREDDAELQSTLVAVQQNPSATATTANATLPTLVS